MVVGKSSRLKVLKRRLAKEDQAVPKTTVRPLWQVTEEILAEAEVITTSLKISTGRISYDRAS
ncbi:hypothetical protein ACFLXK_00240 [Chloroflexota bacterium]